MVGVVNCNPRMVQAVTPTSFDLRLRTSGERKGNRMSSNLKQLSYQDWLQYYDIEEKFEDCDDCAGTGSCLCGCSTEHDCSNCAGMGRLNLSQIEYSLRKESDAKKILWK